MAQQGVGDTIHTRCRLGPEALQHVPHSRRRELAQGLAPHLGVHSRSATAAGRQPQLRLRARAS
eukprot:4074565-Prorocentrum_lima.AAC.1